VTSLGLRFEGAPEVRDLLGRDMRDRWIFEYPIALTQLGRHEIPNAVVHVEPYGETASLPPLSSLRLARVERAIWRRSREIRACYELGQEVPPDVARDVVITVSTSTTGVARVWPSLAQRRPPPVSHCIARALDGMTIPSREYAGTGAFHVDLRPEAGPPP
jgi:hypothetical protein